MTLPVCVQEAADLQAAFDQITAVGLEWAGIQMSLNQLQAQAQQVQINFDTAVADAQAKHQALIDCLEQQGQGGGQQ